MKLTWPSRVEYVIFWSEFVCILFYGLFVVYGDGVNDNTVADSEGAATVKMVKRYPMYMDIHVMVFVGFGFIMTFLKHNSWTAVGFTYLIACWAIQICILASGFWERVCHEYYYRAGFHMINIDVNYLILGDFGACAVLISFGAILGKCSLFQLWVVATIEIIFYCLNWAICTVIWNVKDAGGSMTIHIFGAYFGLAASYFF